jgi:hypothetical protein
VSEKLRLAIPHRTRSLDRNRSISAHLTQRLNSASKQRISYEPKVLSADKEFILGMGFQCPEPEGWLLRQVYALRVSLTFIAYHRAGWSF